MDPLDPAAAHTPFYQDKSFYLAILVPLALAVAKYFGADLDAGMIAGILGPVLAFILGSKAKQALVIAAQAKAAGVQAASQIKTGADAMKVLTLTPPAAP